MARRTGARRLTLDGAVTPGVAETVAGLCVAATVLWGAVWAWGWYNASVRPYLPAEAGTPLRRPRTVRADDAVAVRRLQETTNLLGEATTYLEAGRLEWARETVARVLAIDPENADAQAVLAQVEAATSAAAADGGE